MIFFISTYYVFSEHLWKFCHILYRAGSCRIWGPSCNIGTTEQGHTKPMFKIWQVWKHELSLELIHHKFTDVQRASWRPKFIFQMIENSKFVFLVVYVSLYLSLHYAKTLRLLFMTSVTVSNKVVICNMFRKNCLFNKIIYLVHNYL